MFCHKELSKTNTKKANKIAEIDKLSIRIEQMTTHSAQMKGEETILQNALTGVRAHFKA